MNEQTDGWTDGQTEGWKDRWMDGWLYIYKDGWMDRYRVANSSWSMCLTNAILVGFTQIWNCYLVLIYHIYNCYSYSTALLQFLKFHITSGFKILNGQIVHRFDAQTNLFINGQWLNVLILYSEWMDGWIDGWMDGWMMR